MTDTTTPVLDIKALRVEYPLANGDTLVAVKGIDLLIRPGEIHALVGESGAGKTTVGNALMGLLQAPGKIVSGSIEIAGKPIDLRTGRTAGIIPGRDVGAIFQDPMTSLNPLFTVESQLCEGMLTHLKLARAEAKARALELMKDVGIPEPERRLGSYPHQLSGGQRQRVVIATALACGPKLIVADEPTTALDVSVQAQILKLIRDLADQRGVGVLLVTHNMGVVAEIADRVTIMQNGAVVESGSAREVLTTPKAPYARTLIAAVPPIEHRLERLPVPSEETQVTLDARANVRSKNTKRETGGKDDVILSVRDLAVEYGDRSLIPGRKSSVFRAVKSVSFEVRRGEIFGLVGNPAAARPPSPTPSPVSSLRARAASTSRARHSGRNVKNRPQVLADGVPRSLLGAQSAPAHQLRHRRADPVLQASLQCRGGQAGCEDAARSRGSARRCRQPLLACLLRRPAPAYRHRPRAWTAPVAPHL